MIDAPPRRAFVCVRAPAIGSVELGHGDLIGRLPSAALFIDDPRVSEAHALVSLRRGRLWLLALRRLVGVNGRPVSEVMLRDGIAVALADDFTLEVERVVVPDRVLALAAPGQGERVIGQVVSLMPGDPPSAIGAFVPNAAAHVWTVGDSCHVRVGSSAAREVREGDRFHLGTVEWRVVSVAISDAGHGSTQAEGGVEPPLCLVAYYDSIVIQRAGRPALTIGGVGARIVSELIVRRGPVEWEVLARELWNDDVTSLELRHRWDVALGRLRVRLREHGVRADLVRSDRSGQLQLVLSEHDVVEDRT